MPDKFIGNYVFIDRSVGESCINGLEENRDKKIKTKRWGSIAADAEFTIAPNN
jgi:hypothetical protein